MRTADEEITTEQPVKRGRGRPKGSKNQKKIGTKNTSEYKPISPYKSSHTFIDPATGMAIELRGQNASIVGRIGDEKVTAFVAYHMEMAKMRKGVDKKNVPDLYNRFFTYLQYCQDHGIMPNNMNAYYALGLSRQDIDAWNRKSWGTPEQQEFGMFVKEFFASVHEQGAVEGIINPITSIFWQKAHDGMIEASKLEVVNQDPLGDKKSATQIADQYKDLLPED